MSICIPTPVMPSDEELVEYSNRMWSELDGVRFSDWSDGMKAMSFPFEEVHIPKDLAENTLRFADDPAMAESVFKGYQEILSEPVKRMRGGGELFFAKLNTRSAKDVEPSGSYDSIRTFAATLACSMRTFEDLCWLHRIDKASVIVRPWIDMPRMAEWRCYVKDKQPVGISQYFYDEKFGYTQNQTFCIGILLQEMIHKVIQEMTIDSFVVDFFVGPYMDVKVIETNPYGLSDPCLFESYDEIDGSFRYIRPDGSLSSSSLSYF